MCILDVVLEPRAGTDIVDWTHSLARGARAIAGWGLTLALLWGFAELGERVVRMLGLAVPGSVVGMVLLWVALEAGWVKADWVAGGAGRLLSLLGLLFVPAGAGFVQFIGAGVLWLEVGAVVIAGALVTLAVSAGVVDRLVAGDE
jgi:holin-like protein